MIASLLRSGTAPTDITACEKMAARREQIAATHGVAISDDARSAATAAALVVLAVKPQDFAAAAKPLAGSLTADQTIVSIMAGVSLRELDRLMGHDRLVRAMPNTPAQIGAGFVAWTATAKVNAKARIAVGALLGALGSAVEVADEKQVDMATAVSGSGPGFVYLIIEAFIDAGVRIGMSRELATRMVVETVLGSARLMQATGEHPAVLRNRVTSPGGTTAAGLEEMEAHGVRAALEAAVVQAYQRARDLGA